MTCGQRSFVSSALKESLNEFFKKYNSAVSVEYMSNIEIEEGLNLNVCMDARYVIPKKVKRIFCRILLSLSVEIFLRESKKNSSENLQENLNTGW